jgi:hypothetical protein
MSDSKKGTPAGDPQPVEKMVEFRCMVPAEILVNVYQAGSTIRIPVAKLSEAGKQKIVFYGGGRLMRDGCGSNFEKDDTAEQKKLKAMAHAESRLAALISGEIATGSGGGQRIPTVVKHLHVMVVRWCKTALGIKVKDIPKLGNTVAEVRTVCETFQGCPFDALLKNATAMAEIEDGAILDVTVDVGKAGKKSK